ncbi:MAG: FAD-dependent oxidoreductase, partial [Fibrobacter sp.]|nr:FAD-dependent oxidoreductase [Fibrobacter sp.]
LRYGIPDYKLEKWVLDRRIDQMTAEGVKFERNTAIGEDLSVRYLKKSYDVILLTMGAGEPRDLPVPGRDLKGIHFALEYLTENNRVISGELTEEQRTINAKDKVVLVIGGGDTGADCVGTANRQGAKKVYQFEIMPKPQVWEDYTNPNWPYWPNILRTSTSHEEGCERDWSIQTKGFTGKDGVLQQGSFSRVAWQKVEGSSSPKMVEVPGSEFSLKVDLVFLAMGFVHVQHSKFLDELGIEFDQRGNIKFDKNYATTVPGVFTAGDAGTGASLVVRGIYHGRQAAEAIDQYLRK